MLLFPRCIRYRGRCCRRAGQRRCQTSDGACVLVATSMSIASASGSPAPSKSTRVFVCEIPEFSSSSTSSKILHANVEASTPLAFYTFSCFRCSLPHFARRQFLWISTPPSTWNQQNHHSKALTPSAIRRPVVTMHHDPVPTFGRYSAADRAPLALSILLFASTVKKAVVGRNSTVVCTLVVQCWSFGKPHLVQKRHRSSNCGAYVEPRTVTSICCARCNFGRSTHRSLPRFAVRSFLGPTRTASRCGIGPHGLSVSPRRLRVRHLLRRTHPLDFLLEQHAFDFRPLIGDHNLHRRVWTKLGVM